MVGPSSPWSSTKAVHPWVGGSDVQIIGCLIVTLYIDDPSYQICILTNQGSISLATTPKTLKADAKSLSAFKAKVTAILSHFEFPILLLAATARDHYRKPRTGMWTELLEDLDFRLKEPDFKASFFVGDAGGRAATMSRKADHACSDRDFAANVGIDFYTPEEYFYKEAPSPFRRTFEPSDYLNTAVPTSTDTTPVVFEKRSEVDLVIMCGSPASGKSTFYWTKLKPLGYERVNQDILKTQDKCVKVAKSLLTEAVPVAIDNTNADRETRAVWINLASQFNIPIRCVYFNAATKLCEHNDTVRALVSSDAVGEFNPEKRTILPHSAFAGFASRFSEPKLNEGFQDIVKVHFQVRSRHPEAPRMSADSTVFCAVSRQRRAEAHLEQVLDLSAPQLSRYK